MEERYWFKPHKTGLVLYPIKWQGWVVTVMYFAGLVYSFVQAQSKSQTTNETLVNFLPGLFVFSALFIIVVYLKGKPPVWKEKKS
jgi:Na+-translocating ferredoxin:NAD+ oxidoreductase RnfD subunit